ERPLVMRRQLRERRVNAIRDLGPVEKVLGEEVHREIRTALDRGCVELTRFLEPDPAQGLARAVARDVRQPWKHRPAAGIEGVNLLQRDEERVLRNVIGQARAGRDAPAHETVDGGEIALKPGPNGLWPALPQ